MNLDREALVAAWVKTFRAFHGSEKAIPEGAADRYVEAMQELGDRAGRDPEVGEQLAAWEAKWGGGR